MTNLYGIISALSRGLSVGTGFLIGVITLIVCADVASRALLGASIHSAGEIAILLMVAMIFLGFAGAQADRANYSVELVTGMMPPRSRAALAVLTTALACAAIALLAWYSTRRAMVSFGQGEATYGVIAFPVWPSRIVIAVGLWVLALQLFADVLATLARFVSGEAEPPASERAPPRAE